MAADHYPLVKLNLAISKTEAFAEIPAPQSLYSEAESIPITQEEKINDIFQPIPEELNLAHFFPEGEDQSDISKSYAQKAFTALMTHDAQWSDSIYNHADMTPEQFASRTGQPKSKVIGTYNPKDSLHDPDNPDSWIIHSFRNIRTNATNGDGQPISVYSNVIEIMSAANVYCYYKDAGNYDLFLSYAMALWKKSHSYSLSMSDVYYCEGCLSEEDEKARLEQEAAASYKDIPDMVQTFSEGESTAGESVSETSASEVSILETSASEISGPETSASKTLASEVSDSETSASDASVSERPASETAVPDASVPEMPASEAAVPKASVSGMSVPEASASETAVPDAEANEDSSHISSDISEIQNRSNTIEAGDEGNSPFTELSDISSEGSDFTAAKTIKEATPANSGDFDTVSKQESMDREDVKCPGHIDLVVQIKILGIKEKNGLFRADPTGNLSDNFEENGWQGWTPEAVDSVKILASQDWYQKYGLTVSSISMRNPLSNSEIDEYINRLPADLSQTRREIIRFALSSVGRVPYYWGGKASAPDYSGNSFGTPITPDEKGRILKGLDCSGWINWVYWSVTGNRLPHESTSGLAVCGTAVSRDNLQPGDIILRTGDDAHVIMFLEWTEDGQIRCIHESSANINNVTVAIREANWPYYRKLIE